MMFIRLFILMHTVIAPISIGISDGKYNTQASAFAQAIANVVKNGQGSKYTVVEHEFYTLQQNIQNSIFSIIYHRPNSSLC